MSPRPEGVRGATIVGTGMYVPDRILTNQDLEKMVDTSDEWILERTGIRERRISAPDQASSDLSLIAARRALEMAEVAPEEIDHIIVATTSPDRNPCVLFGDGAGAAVLRPCAPDEGVLAVSIHSDGTMGDLLEIPGGGSLHPASHETVDRKDHFIHMRGRELFRVAVRGMEDSL